MAAMDASAGFTFAAMPCWGIISCIILGDIPIVPIPAGSIDPIPPKAAGSLSWQQGQ
jgi:hypothetical protein